MLSADPLQLFEFHKYIPDTCHISDNLAAGERKEEESSVCLVSEELIILWKTNDKHICHPVYTAEPNKHECKKYDKPGD